MQRMFGSLLSGLAGLAGSAGPHARPSVVFHIDRDGLAKGVWRRGEVNVLVVDDRDPDNRIYRIAGENSVDELRRRLGGHPLSALLDDKNRDKTGDKNGRR